MPGLYLPGSIPLEFATNFRRLMSFIAEDNPLLCGGIPAGMAVDWRWHLENQAGTSRDWFGRAVHPHSTGSRLPIHTSAPPGARPPRRLHASQAFLSRSVIGPNVRSGGVRK